jgi:outer membrane protein OmpA-like peptidoglycan-associated protein
VIRGLGWLLAPVAGLALVACPSAYQRTYDQDMAQMEAQRQAARSQEAAAHAEAQRYASVVYFATGSAALDDKATAELNWFLQQLQPYPLATFEVNGFADKTGTEAKNQQLSTERAQAVAAYLQAHGIASSRLYLQAFATQFPASSNASAQGRRDNRRVEVTVR